MDGTLIHVCDSIGYGIPYAVQYSNPMKSPGMPQSEPNGLFPPSSAEGTWVMCAAPNSQNGVDPLDIEPPVIVSPHKLRSTKEYQLN
jgi:hypothetical protein